MKEKTLLLFKKLLRHELISGSFYLFVSVIVSGFLSFVLNLFFARSLTKPDYGIYAALLSLVTLFTIPAQSLTPIIVRFAGDYYAKKENEKLKKFYFKATKMLGSLSVFLFIIFIVFSSFIKDFLRLDSFYYIYIVGICIAFAYLGLVNTGFLQGLLRFGFISFSQVASSIFRLVIGIAFVILGLRVFGAISSTFFSYLATLLLGFIPLKFLFTKIKTKDVNVPTKDLIKYAIPTSITVLSLFSFISTDVILVRHFFTPFQAGLYGGLALIGKVIYYFTGPIPTVMFPLLVKGHANNKPFKKLFYLSLLLVFIPSFVISAFYFLFPAFTVKFFLGKGYEQIIPFVFLFGIYIGVFSLLNVCVNLFLSLNKTRIFIPVLIGAVLQIILISLFHSGFFQVIIISILISGLLFAGLLFYFLFNFSDFVYKKTQK
jgi:O-antigen/teichoic acid export membrane protein